MIGEVSNVAFGGQGIIRQEGLVVFIPFTAIGDTIRYRIVQTKKNFAFGKLENVIVPSPNRTTPLCPYFGTCGGCQLQHINYTTQLEYKRQWIEDALTRQAGLKGAVAPPLIPSEKQWAYRRRVSLTLKPHQNHYQAGYIAIDNKTLLEINQCPIFTENNPIFTVVHEISRSLINSDNNDAKLTILKNNDRFMLHFHFKTLPKNAAEVLKVASNHSSILGIVVTSAQKTLEYGNSEIAFNVNDLNFNFSPRAFVQTHPEQSVNIYHEICQQSAMVKKGPALDLYCGIGISSLLLAQQGFEVTGIEANATAIQLAKKNAQNNKINNVRFLKEEVEKNLHIHLEREKPNFVIVNPPREGLMPTVLQALIEFPVETLVYVSCMPSTLARDLKQLCQNKYQLCSVQAFDMFPQTTHVETLVVLKHLAGSRSNSIGQS